MGRKVGCLLGKRVAIQEFREQRHNYTSMFKTKSHRRTEPVLEGAEGDSSDINSGTGDHQETDGAVCGTRYGNKRNL